MRNNILNTLILLFFTLGFNSLVFAQSANIRGFVYESESAEPVIFTSVLLKGTTYGAQTDVNGYFSITKLPAGSYTMMITMLGHDTLQESITVKDNEIVTKKLYLKEIFC